MSRKHHQRTRAEILNHRRIMHQQLLATYGRLRGATGRLPHIGTKEQSRAKRLYLSHDLNQQFIDRMYERGLFLSDEMCHLRSAPTLCQMSKREYAEVVRERVAA